MQHHSQHSSRDDNPLERERLSGRDVYSQVTEQILEKLSDGSVPWRKPWSGGLPKNLVSGKNYRGVNALLLGFCTDYPSKYWLSFKQAKEKGGFVRRGEHGQAVVYWHWRTPEEMAKLAAALGKEHVSPCFPFVSRVFNLCQCDGIAAPPDDIQTRAHFRLDEAEAVVAGMPNRPRIEYVNSSAGARAGYSPSEDRIVIPVLERFESAEEFYSTLFHEMIHSTGHKSRVNREAIRERGHWGDADYSKEELVAEMGSAFLCAEVGIGGRTVDNSAAYIGGWLSVLKADRRMLVEAAQAAQHAVDYILDVRHAERVIPAD